MRLFKDHFSSAGGYSLFRPSYPVELYDFLAQAAPARGLAWDCATGGGQAAGPLAERFERVLASDASVGQLSRRRDLERVGFAASLAEAAPLADGAVDLLAVPQALHWFSFERFFAEAERVLAASGVIAAWTYDTLRIDREVDALVDWMHNDEVGPYWPPERLYVDSRYESIPFPFARLETPELEMTASWDRHRLLGYIGSWSAVARYREARGSDPLPRFERRLERIWPQAEARRRVTWRLTLLAGQVR